MVDYVEKTFQNFEDQYIIYKGTKSDDIILSII